MKLFMLSVVGVVCLQVSGEIAEESSDSHKIHLSFKNFERTLQTSGYPKFAHSSRPSFAWTLVGPKGSSLDIFCDEINTNKSNSCAKKLLIWDIWNRHHKFFGPENNNPIKARSSRNELSLTLETEDGGEHRIHCTVRLVPSTVEEDIMVGLTSCPCGWTKKREISGAREITYPFLTNLKHQGTNRTFCTGTILTDRHILAAAHCVAKLNTPIEVVIGGRVVVKDSGEDEEEAFVVGNKYLHPVNDIAVLELTEIIIFDDFVGQICLPSERYNLTNKWVTALGYDKLSAEDPAFPLLQTVDIAVMDMKSCNQSDSDNLDRKGQTQLCSIVPYGNSTQCATDGSLIYLDLSLNRYVQVGLTSLGAGCVVGGKSTVNMTDVYDHIDWIQGIISKYYWFRHKTCEKTEI